LQVLQLPYLERSQALINRLQSAPGFIWFHEGGTQGRCEWFSAWPQKTFEYLGNQATRVTTSKGDQEIISGDFIALLKTSLRAENLINNPPFTSGLAGHLTYDFGLERLTVSSKFKHPSSPLAVVGDYRWSCYTNHALKTTTLYIHDDCEPATQTHIKKLVETEISTYEKLKSATGIHISPWRTQMTKAEYWSAFNAIQNYLIEGDIYQANLTRQWQATTTTEDLAIYRTLIKGMPAPFSVFQRCPSHSLLSVSPERFIQVSHGKIMTQPIKGTRPRGAHAEQDLAYKTELMNSEKDKAENLMIVDLLRNDIAKNAKPGTVHVDKLFEVQSFKNVHHLVSTITAQMKEESTPLDVLADAFPGGSITGAPKKRAMEIIDELEKVRRGAYCGSAFYLSDNGYMDSNILIRTLTHEGSKLTCHGGGGIVIDSTAEDEYEESAIKVSRILTTLSGGY
jgi:para-aminobenzoate synthetase component 1